MILALFVAAVLFGGVLTVLEVLVVRDTVGRTAHSREVLIASGDVRLGLTDAELAVRGYLLTGNLSYLDDYAEARNELRERLRVLVDLTADDPPRRAQLEPVGDRVELRLAGLDAVAAAGRDAGSGEGGGGGEYGGGGAVRARLVETLAGGENPSSVLRAFEAEEDRLLEAQTAATGVGLRRTLWTVAAATAALLTLLLGSAYLMRRQQWMALSAEEERRGFDRVRGELKDFHQRVLDSTAEGIYGLDEEGRCTFMNRAGAMMLGAEPEHFLGRNMHAEAHHTREDGTAYPEEACPIRAALLGESGCRVSDEVFWRLDGECFPVEYSSFPLAGPAGVSGGAGRGTSGGAVVTFADVTRRLRDQDELRAARDEAEAANDAKSQFLANMSHELRTPLNAVIMYSELLAEEAEDRGQPDFIPDLRKIRAAGRHLLELVNGVLDLSKIEAGKMELFYERFGFEPMLREIETTVQPLVEKNGNAFTWTLDPSLQEMTGDLVKVRQVLYNLLSNAAKFTTDGSVSLTVEPADDPAMIRFVVADRGIGMTPEQLAKLFQPFVQADASTTREYGGTGLGLAIIRRFTDLMGGEVSVTSVEGEGTRFTVTLPREPVEGGEQAAEPERPGAALAAVAALEEAAPVVLIVDDDPAIRDTLVRVMVSEGLRPVTASNGEEGLLRAAELRPALIILDVKMPKVDGWTVLAALKADPDLADIPVVVQSVEDQRNLGITLGAVEFLVKPVDRGRLVRVVQSYLHGPDASALIVDDDAATREVIAQGLEERGWRTLQAGHGGEAVELLEAAGESLPRIILLDLNMPVMDGFAFIDELAKRPEWSSIPVVVLTAQDLTAEDRTRLQAGVERVLLKNGMDRVAFLQHVRRLVVAVTRPAAAEAASKAAAVG